MARRRKFSIIFAPEVTEHLDVVDRKYHRMIRRTIDEQLSHTPDKPTRNRKSLEGVIALGARWELRCGPQNRFRVFYEVDIDAKRVHVLAIGIKEGGRLRVGGEEIEL